MATQDNYIRTALRVPPKLHARIHESAKENNRTFNAEIVVRLEESFHDTAAIDNAILHMLAEQQTATIQALQKLAEDLTVELHHLRKGKKG